MNLRGRFIFFISVIIAGSAVGKDYVYEFGSDAGDEFYGKGDNLVDAETEIIVEVPNGIEGKMVKILVTSEDEPQVNTTFGDPSIRAAIKFEHAPPPGSYYNITVKGVAKEGQNVTLDAGGISDNTTAVSNADVNNTPSDDTVAAEHIRRSAVSEVDNEALAPANDSAVEAESAAPVADVDEVSQSAATEVDIAVSDATNQSDSATVAAGHETAADTVSNISADDIRRSAIPEAENTVTDAANDTAVPDHGGVETAAATESADDSSLLAADDTRRSAVPETEDASTAAANNTVGPDDGIVEPAAATESAGEAPLLDTLGDVSLSGASASENTSMAANEKTEPAAEAESNSTATIEDNRRSAVPDQASQSGNKSQAVENDASAAAELGSEIPVAVNQSDSPATELNGDEALDQDLAQSVATNDSDVAGSDSKSQAAVPYSESVPESVSENKTTVSAIESNGTMADEAEPQANAKSEQPAADSTANASDNTSAAVSEPSTTTLATPALENEKPSNFALDAVKGLANAAQAAFENVLGLPPTAADDNGNANNAELAGTDATTTLGPDNGPPDEESLNLSLF